MFSRSFFGAIALQTLFATAFAGKAIIHNKCSYDVTLLSTSTNIQAPILKGATHSEALNGHQSLKIAKDPKLMWDHGITQFEYTVGDRLWYDISFVDCANGSDGSRCPGHDGGLKMTASAGAKPGDCAVAQCAPGNHCPTQAYFKWNDDKATKSCQLGQTEGDIVLTLCSGGAAPPKRSIAGRISF